MRKISVILILLILVTLSCKSNKPTLFKHRFFRMDTVVDVTISTSPKIINSDSVWSKLDGFLKNWEIYFSSSKKKSEILAINSRKSDTVNVSHNLATMVKIGIDYGDTVGGMFDITVLPLKKLWGLGENGQNRKTIPPKDSLNLALSKINYKSIFCDTIKNIIVFDSPETKIDVGGVAKGVSLKKMGNILENLGIENYLVSAGGDIVAKGNKPDGSLWRIAIENPRAENPIAVFAMNSGAVVTSGDYERYTIINGKRYCHIFNPQTGISSSKNSSLTIKCENPILADILSTGLFSLPSDSIIQFIESRDNLECLIIDSLQNIFISSGWKKDIKLIN